MWFHICRVGFSRWLEMVSKEVKFQTVQKGAVGGRKAQVFEQGLLEVK